MIPPHVPRQEITMRAHTGFTGDHQDQVQRRAYWRGWREDVLHYCERCSEYARYHRGGPPRHSIAENDRRSPMGARGYRLNRETLTLNGTVERFHRTLNAMFGRVVCESQTDWIERVSMVMAAYRASRHEATGYSPHFLVIGREVRAPIDRVQPYETNITHRKLST